MDTIQEKDHQGWVVLLCILPILIANYKYEYVKETYRDCYALQNCDQSRSILLETILKNLQMYDSKDREVFRLELIKLWNLTNHFSNRQVYFEFYVSLYFFVWRLDALEKPFAKDYPLKETILIFQFSKRTSFSFWRYCIY